MLWKSLLCCLVLAGTVSVGASEPSTLHYTVSVRTLTSIPDIGNMYTGLLMKLELKVIVKNPNLLFVTITNAQGASIKPTYLPDGWTEPIPTAVYHQIPSGWTVKVELNNNGSVANIFCPSDAPPWYCKLAAGTIYQKQITHSELMNRENFSFFQTTEKSIPGTCQVTYDVRPATAVDGMSAPFVLPPEKLRDHHIISKSWNYTQCSSMEKLTMGPSDPKDFDVGGNAQLPISRSSQITIWIHGDLNNFTIKHIESNSTLSVGPQLDNKQKAEVFTNMIIKPRRLRPIPHQPSKAGSELLDDYEGYLKDSETVVGSRYVPYDYRKDDPQDLLSIHVNPSQLGRTIENSIGNILGDEGYGRIWSASGYPYQIRDAERNISEIVPDIAVEIFKNLSEGRTKEGLAQVMMLRKMIRIMSLKDILNTYTILEKWNKQCAKLFITIVATVGTTNPVLAVEGWRNEKVIENEEAAEYFRMQETVVFNPNREYLWNLSLMVKNAKELPLNLRAKYYCTFTTILRRVAVRNKMHKDIIMDAITHFRELIFEAAKSGHNEELQLALYSYGNIGHWNVFDVLNSVVNGTYQVPDGTTEYMRLIALLSMNRLNELYPKPMIKYWRSIYTNTFMSYKFRIIAISLLMEVNPPAWELQKMAQGVHNESNTQVKSAVISKIRSLAQLRGPHNQNIAEKAKSALHLLPKWEIDDWSYSRSIYDSFKIDGEDLSYTDLWNILGSTDILLPLGFRHKVIKNLGGYRISTQTSGLVSSMNDTIEAVHKLFRRFLLQRTDVARLIRTKEFPDIHVGRRPVLEGYLDLPFNCFMPFNYTTLHNMFEEWRKLFDGVQRPVEILKLVPGSERMFVVPNEIGLPLLYTYTTLNYINVTGNITLDIIHTPTRTHVLAKGALDPRYALHEESKIGFITEWNYLDYLVGLDDSTQVHLPLNFTTDVVVDRNLKVECVKTTLQPQLASAQEMNGTTIFQRSTEPHATVLYLLTHSPPIDANNPNTTYLHVGVPTSINYEVGKNTTGMVLRVDNYYEGGIHNISKADDEFAVKNHLLSTVYRWLYQRWKGYNIPSLIHFPLASRDIYSSSLNITFDYKECTAENLTFFWKGDSNKVIPTETVVRRPKCLRSLGVPVTEDIPPQEKAPSSTLYEFVWNTTFVGETNAAFGAEIAVLTNVIDQSIRSHVQWWHRPAVDEHWDATLNMWLDVPPVDMWNFKNALRGNPNSTIAADLVVTVGSSSSKFCMNGTLNRSLQRQDYISRSPMAKACLNQMHSGQNLLPECQNVTEWANLLDAFELDIQLPRKIPRELRRLAYTVYSVIRQWLYSEVKEDVFQVDKNLKAIYLRLYVNNQSTAFNTSLVSSLVNANGTDIPLPSWAKPLIPNAGNNLNDRYLEYMYPIYASPSFVVDNGVSVTLDKTVFPLTPTTCWFVGAAHTPKWLASAPHNQEQVYHFKDLNTTFIFGVNERKLVNSILNVSSITIEVLGKKIHHNSATVLLNGIVKNLKNNEVIPFDGGYMLLQFGVVEIILDASHFHGLRQGPQRLMLRIRNSMRESVSGLAGYFNGEKYDDFTSPKGCVENNPVSFVADWADCVLPTPEDAKCYYVNNTKASHHLPHSDIPHPGIDISSEESGEDSSSSCSRSSSESQEQIPMDIPIIGGLISKLPDIEGHISTSGIGGQISPSGIGPLSLPGIEAHIGLQQQGSVTYSTDVKKNDDVTCFSRNPIPKCRPGLRAESHQMKEVTYCCIPNGPLADLFEKQAAHYGIIEHFKEKPVHMSVMMGLPVNCKH